MIHTKPAKEVKPGDKILMEDRSVATVTLAKRGFIRYENDPERSVYIEHSKGWSQMRASAKVECVC